MKIFKIIFITLCFAFPSINSMGFDINSALDRALDEFDDTNSNKIIDLRAPKANQQEIKRDLEEPSSNQSGLSVVLPSEDSDQELRSQIELLSPSSDKASIDRLLNLVKTSRKKDIATGAALAYRENGNKIFEQQGKIGSHEDRIAILEKLINKFEASLNQAIGGFNQGKELLLKQLNDLKAEMKELNEEISQNRTHLAVLDANQNNEKERIDRLENALNTRIAGLERELYNISGIVRMFLSPLETVRNLEESYTRNSELMFLGSAIGLAINNQVIKASGTVPIIGFPLKHFVSAVSLPLKLTLATNLALSSYKLAKKHAYIKEYKKSIAAGASAAAGVATGVFAYKKYLQAAKFFAQMRISF